MNGGRTFWGLDCSLLKPSRGSYWPWTEPWPGWAYEAHHELRASLPATSLPSRLLSLLCRPLGAPGTPTGLGPFCSEFHFSPRTLPSISREPFWNLGSIPVSVMCFVHCRLALGPPKLGNAQPSFGQLCSELAHESFNSNLCMPDDVYNILAYQCPQVNIKGWNTNVYRKYGQEICNKGTWSKKARDHDNVTLFTHPCICCFSNYSFIHLAVLGRSCGTWDLLRGMPTLICSMWGLVSWSGIKPGSPALRVQSLSHWTTREVPVFAASCLFLPRLLLKELMREGLSHRVVLPKGGTGAGFT